VDWDPTVVPADATSRNAQVRIWTILSATFGSSYERRQILAPPKETRLLHTKKPFPEWLEEYCEELG